MTESEIQREVSNFVDREIFTCQSMLIDELLKKEIVSWDEIENIYNPDNEDEAQEIFEWWLVSSWIGKKLLLEGEPVLDNGYGIWWGRTTTGQAISLDYVIKKIYNDIRG